ncbi:MAG: Acetoin dehydrogenase operon transcriptional activator AcoR [Syntrophaceae bacterium PtaU1.Bin231]|nr:MAG: Acetoin dehydrogenase operon transcriptional activator AcoR [Syntrophaceae bacterium PtaU1.Bin231]
MNVDRAKLKAAWNEFVSTGTVSGGAVRDEILLSWKRCRADGLDPRSETVPGHLTETEKENVLKANRVLIDAARPFLEGLSRLISGLQMVLFLTDRDGFILDAIGEGEIWEYCRKNNAVIGNCFSEANFGTTAPSLALKLGTPCQIAAEEHYLQVIQLASCAAAPIHDKFNNIIGTLDITSTYESAQKHPHTFGMIVAAARAIENQLRVTEELRALEIASQYLRSAMETMTDGLVILDEKGDVTHINRAAERILAVRSGTACGKNIRSILESGEILDAVETDGTLDDHEIILGKPGRRERCLLTLHPIVDPGSRKIGSLIVLREFKKVQSLVKQVAGFDARYRFSDIRGTGRGIRKTIALAKRVAGSGSNVVICGESGTGKEMLAQSIHNHGPQSGGPFLGLNCSAIPNDLIESELFGYEAGTFTGALASGKPGRFELANGGTLFLDEVNGMSLDMQAKLLRVLEERKFLRLGGKHCIPLEAAIIAASNRPLEEEVEKGNFRSDLYYRLNVVEIDIPPLRERREDIETLIGNFMEEIGNRLKKDVTEITPEAMDYLKNQPWPGNVRQLKNWIERAITLAEGTVLSLEDFAREQDAGKTAGREKKEPPVAQKTYAIRLSDVESTMIRTALEESEGNVSGTARKLGISRDTLYRKMKKYDMTVQKSVE